MSKIVRQIFNKKHSMPDSKVMGTINSKISSKLTRLIMSGDKSDIVEIIDHINVILDTRISNISADLFQEPFTSNAIISSNYDEPTGVFYLINQGNAELIVGSTRIKLMNNKIVFVNERNSHYIEKLNKSNLVMLSGRFTWDIEKHGET